MKLQDVLIPVSMAVAITLLLQLFWPSGAQQTDPDRSGQYVKAQQVADPLMTKPLLTEIDFDDTDVSIPETITAVDTPLAIYNFSNYGASLISLAIKKEENRSDVLFDIIARPGTLEQEKHAFLVAFEKQTPFYFKQESHDVSEKAHHIVYVAHTKAAVLKKHFTVYTDTYRVDLQVTLTPQQDGVSVQPRIFMIQPHIDAQNKSDKPSGIVNNPKKALDFIADSTQMFNGYWSSPSLFGIQTRYFVHSAVADENRFIKRGYYAKRDDSLFFVLEGPEVVRPTEWTVSFYCGPKSTTAFAAVDPRLDYTFDYGMLKILTQPLSRWFLALLEFFNSYVHSYGLAIILLTLLIRLLLLPFTYKADEGMKRSAELQKKLQYVQEKYKNDPQGLAQARADLMRKYGVPGMSGCLPALAQIPLFLALSWMLSNSIQLHKVSFLWIPDLSMPDPYYIFPLLVGITIIMHTTKGDPKQRLSSIALGLILAAVFTSLSAGLALYLSLSTLAGVLQTTFFKMIKR